MQVKVSYINSGCYQLEAKVCLIHIYEVNTHKLYSYIYPLIKSVASVHFTHTSQSLPS